MRSRKYWTAAFALLAALCAAGSDKLHAETRGLAGMRFDISSAWRRTTEGWVLGSDGTSLASFDATVSPGFMPVGQGTLEQGRRALEEEMRGRGFKSVEVLEARSVMVDGAPAARLRARVGIGGRSLEQLLLLVSGRDTLVLTFTSDSEGFEDQQDEFERIVGSVRVLERAGLWDRTPPSLCGVFLGLIAGASCAAWRRQMQR